MGIEAFNHGPATRNHREDAEQVVIRKVNLAPGQTLGELVMRKVASGAYGVYDYWRLCEILGIDPTSSELLSEIEEDDPPEVTHSRLDSHMHRSRGGTILGNRNPHH